jgi:branched-chain amino acid transport system permease protein
VNGAKANVATLLAGTVVCASLPFFISSYALRLLDLSLISAVAVIGLCFAFGYAGLLHLGQAAFVGFGAYGSALLATRFGIGFWLSMPIAVVLTVAVALLIGTPMLRLRGHYLALATVGLNVTTEIVSKNWIELTNGDNGLSGIPGIAISAFRFDTDRRFFYLILVVLALVSLIALAVRHSRFGRAMIAVRDDEMACAASGISVLGIRLLAFAIAGACGGLSGALYAHFSHYVAPTDFDLVKSISLLVMLIVGGEMSILGAIGGSILISFAPEMLRFLGEAYLAVFGIGVLIVLVVMPDGVAGAMSRLSRFAVARHD